MNIESEAKKLSNKIDAWNQEVVGGSKPKDHEAGWKNYKVASTV